MIQLPGWRLSCLPNPKLAGALWSMMARKTIISTSVWNTWRINIRHFYNILIGETKARHNMGLSCETRNHAVGRKFIKQKGPCSFNCMTSPCRRGHRSIRLLYFAPLMSWTYNSNPRVGAKSSTCFWNRRCSLTLVMGIDHRPYVCTWLVVAAAPSATPSAAAWTTRPEQQYFIWVLLKDNFSGPLYKPLPPVNMYSWGRTPT